MRGRDRFAGMASMDRHRRVAVVLAGVCLVAMAVGVTPQWSIGQMIGGAMSVLAFGSIIALATAPREEPRKASVAGRIDGVTASGRRAA
jgi:hypothetical protein